MTQKIPNPTRQKVDSPSKEVEIKRAVNHLISVHYIGFYFSDKRTSNPKVEGSNPSGRATSNSMIMKGLRGFRWISF